MIVRYTIQAKDDVDTAMGWYETQRKGLGFEFLDCVEVTITKIVETPTLYPMKHKTLRAALTRRFPFSIFYSVEIIIHAVFDNRQNPAKRP